MTAPVFVDPQLSAARVGESVVLSGDEARHAIAVRRIREGEIIHVVNGRGLRVIGEVTAASKPDSRLELRAIEVVTEAAPEPRLTLIQALAKGGRDEAAVEMACEVGVDDVVPWQAQRSVVTWPAAKAERRRERWESIVLAAAKQSRRAFVPTVSAMATSRQLAEQIRSGGCWLILHESATQSILDIDLPETEQIAVIVGPEGGISDEELELFASAGAQPVLVGPHVMRSSTAGPVAIAHLASRIGRWNSRVD